MRTNCSIGFIWEKHYNIWYWNWSHRTSKQYWLPSHWPIFEVSPPIPGIVPARHSTQFLGHTMHDVAIWILAPGFAFDNGYYGNPVTNSKQTLVREHVFAPWLPEYYHHNVKDVFRFNMFIWASVTSKFNMGWIDDCCLFDMGCWQGFKSTVNFIGCFWFICWFGTDYTCTCIHSEPWIDDN